MEPATALLWIAAGAGAGGVATLRYAWSLEQRSAAWNGAGWGALVLAAILAAVAAGAWGVAIVGLAATACALALLGEAASRSPPGRAEGSKRRAFLLPEGGEPRRLGRRFVTFLLVMVAGWAVAIGIALSLRGIGMAIGWGEANANVAALFAVPIVWGILACALLMQSRRRTQLATLLVCCVPAAPMLMGIWC